MRLEIGSENLRQLNQSDAKLKRILPGHSNFPTSFLLSTLIRTIHIKNAVGRIFRLQPLLVSQNGFRSVEAPYK